MALLCGARLQEAEDVLRAMPWGGDDGGERVSEAAGGVGRG